MRLDFAQRAWYDKKYTGGYRSYRNLHSIKQEHRVTNGSPVRARYWPATVMRGACKSAVRQVGRRATAAVSKISLGTEICINMELDVSLPRKSAGIRDHCGRLRGIGNAEHMQTVRERTVCFFANIAPARRKQSG